MQIFGRPLDLGLFLKEPPCKKKKKRRIGCSFDYAQNTFVTINKTPPRLIFIASLVEFRTTENAAGNIIYESVSQKV